MSITNEEFEKRVDFRNLIAVVDRYFTDGGNGDAGR